MKVAGKIIGGLNVGFSANNYINNPTTANLLDLAVSVGSLAGGVVTSLAVGLADTTGLTAKVYSYLGPTIDSTMGYSVGQSVFKHIEPYVQQFINTSNAQPVIQLKP